ncbi:MAG: hypothetical protein HRT88_20610, partial [Lentisphaeraceae bacterium]|nr:hypothetical protein [Lentisphaeraceae bacterium]
FIISSGFLILYSISYGPPPANLLKASALIMLSTIPMAAVVLFFSSFLNEAVAATMSCIAIWLGYVFFTLNGYTLYDLSTFNMSAEAYYNNDIPTFYLIKAACSATLSAVSIVCITSYIFNKRDL